MIILSHRGYWKKPDEKNLEVAFRRSFDLGYGTETDIRDCAGKILISHDMPKGDEMTFEHFLGLVASRPCPLPSISRPTAWPAKSERCLIASAHMMLSFSICRYRICCSR